MTKLSKLIVLTLLVAAAACGEDKSSSPKPAEAPKVATPPSTEVTTPTAPTTPTEVATPPPSGPQWPRYSSASGGYAIDMPATPRESSEPVETAIGSGTMHMATASDNGGMYMVQMFDYAIAPPDLAGAYASARDAMVATYPGAQLTAEREISLDGHAGRSLSVDVPSERATVKIHHFIIGNRAYQLMALGPAGGGAADAQRFFDSFALAN